MDALTGLLVAESRQCEKISRAESFPARTSESLSEPVLQPPVLVSQQSLGV